MVYLVTLSARVAKNRGLARHLALFFPFCLHGRIAAAVVAIAALCCIGAMAKKEKEGKPVFAPVHNPVNERVAEKA